MQLKVNGISDHVVELISHIGLSLEKMLSCISSKTKLICFEDILQDEIDDTDVSTASKITKLPHYLGFNPKIVNIDDTADTDIPVTEKRKYKIY